MYRRYQEVKTNGTPSQKMFSQDFDLRVAINMAEDAQAEGRIYGNLHKRPVSNVDLEHAFGSLSKSLVPPNDLFYKDANLFDCFSESQNRYLMYLVSRMLREHHRRNRRRRFLYNSGSLEQTMKDRAWGTYRVEEDVKARLKQKTKPAL